MSSPSAISTTSMRPTPDPEKIASSLRVASKTGHAYVSITIGAPRLDPCRLFGLEPQQSAYYFSDSEQSAEVGLGEALRLTGPDPFDVPSLDRHTATLLEDVFSVGLDAGAQSARLFGGIAYGAPPLATGPWRQFAGIDFVLPRFRYLTNHRDAVMTLTLSQAELSSREACRDWALRWVHLLDSLPGPPAVRRPRRVLGKGLFPERIDWVRQVTEAQQALTRGELEKVVLARQLTLTLDPPPYPEELLERLLVLSPDTQRFAIRRGTSTFLGASPERLVLRRGSELRTDALAGSMRAGQEGDLQSLQSNPKERREHGLVVREIRARLEGLGAQLEVQQTPGIRTLRHVWHLHTPISARMIGLPSVLELVERLHPTPAVGGIPSDAAAEFLRRNETIERGWYAGPVGWLDARGDGEFVVALRSGLIEGSQIHLFAGAGLVVGSDPANEWEETNLKLQALLEALSLEAPP